MANKFGIIEQKDVAALVRYGKTAYITLASVVGSGRRKFLGINSSGKYVVYYTHYKNKIIDQKVIGTKDIIKAINKYNLL